MKRQLVAFLSLFSLVLVLSIYYILSPTIDKKDQVVNLGVQDSTELYFANLKLEQESNYEKDLEEANSIVASATNSNEDKASALQSIEDIKEKYKLETSTASTIENAGYLAAFVEENDNKLTVIVAHSNPTKKDVANILSMVYQNFDNEMMTEINFK